MLAACWKKGKRKMFGRTHRDERIVLILCPYKFTAIKKENIKVVA